MAMTPQTRPWETAPGRAFKKLDNVLSPNSAAGRTRYRCFQETAKTGEKADCLFPPFFKRSGAYTMAVYPSGMATPRASPMTVLNLGVKFSA